MNETLKSELSKQYNLSNISKIEKFDGGYLTENSLVHTERGKFFLKGHRTKNGDRIEQVELSEQFFAKQGIPVILPLETKHKTYHFKHNNGVCVLYPFINMETTKREDITDKHLVSLGKLLAEMHLSVGGTNFSESVKKQKPEWDSISALKKINEIKEIQEKIKTKSEFDVIATEALSLKIKFINSNKIIFNNLSLPEECLLHGDYHDGNVFFDENAEVRWLFDFEKTEVGARLSEVARSLWFICFNNTYTDEQFRKATIFLNEYNRTYPFKKEHLKDAITAYLVKRFYSTWIEGEHYLVNNYRVDHFLVGELDSLRYMNENFDAFIKRIVDSIFY